MHNSYLLYYAYISFSNSFIASIYFFFPPKALTILIGLPKSSNGFNSKILVSVKSTFLFEEYLSKRLSKTF